MGATVRFVSPTLVRDFRARHGIKRQEDLGQIFGVQLNSAQRWDSEGGAMYVGLLLAYAEKYGIERMRRLARMATNGTLPPYGEAEINRFLNSQQMTNSEFARLFGFTSPRTITNWKRDGVPKMIHILLRSLEECGAMLFRLMNGGKDIAGHKTLYEATSMKQVVDSFNLPDGPADEPSPPPLRDRISPEVLKTALDKLDERERDILLSRRLSDDPWTFEDLGEKYNVTRQRVQQIETKAWEKFESALVGA